MYTSRPPAARREPGLLAGLEDEAQGLGYDRVQLETGARQPEAIALYEAAGYRRIAAYGQFEDRRVRLLRQGPLTARGQACRQPSPSIGPGGPERTYHSHP